LDNNDKIRLKDLSRNPYRDYVDNRNFFQKAVYSINKVLYVYSLIWETNKWIMLAFAHIQALTHIMLIKEKVYGRYRCT
jgi:hypothetical protein